MNGPSQWQQLGGVEGNESSKWEIASVLVAVEKVGIYEKCKGQGAKCKVQSKLVIVYERREYVIERSNEEFGVCMGVGGGLGNSRDF